VIERSPFGVRLWRLLSHRRPTFETSIEQMVAALATSAGVPRSEITAMVEGGAPTPDAVRRLGPALGFHTADMFVIAGLPVPHDVASAWPTSPWDVGSIIKLAARMGARQLHDLDELVRSLPVLPPSGPAPTDDYPEWPGALMLRLLRNRNIRPYNAQILHFVGGGPCVSDSTVAMLGSGKVVMTPQYVTAFANLLGYAPEDMVALAGIGPADANESAHPARAELAALAWNARRLNGDQLTHVVAAARDLT
jgi:hypothetical protein